MDELAEIETLSKDKELLAYIPIRLGSNVLKAGLTYEIAEAKRQIKKSYAKFAKRTGAAVNAKYALIVSPKGSNLEQRVKRCEINGALDKVLLTNDIKDTMLDLDESHIVMNIFYPDPTTRPTLRDIDRVVKDLSVDEYNWRLNCGPGTNMLTLILCIEKRSLLRPPKEVLLIIYKNLFSYASKFHEAVLSELARCPENFQFLSYDLHADKF